MFKIKITFFFAEVSFPDIYDNKHAIYGCSSFLLKVWDLGPWLNYNAMFYKTFWILYIQNHKHAIYV